MFAMTTASFIPLYGSLSDIFGVNIAFSFLQKYSNLSIWLTPLLISLQRKASLITAIIIYEIGQIITGAAAGSNAAIQIIVGRAIAGVGNGGIVTLLFVVVTDVVPVSLTSYSSILRIFLTKKNCSQIVETRSTQVSRNYQCYLGYLSHRWPCPFWSFRRQVFLEVNIFIV